MDSVGSEFPNIWEQQDGLGIKNVGMRSGFSKLPVSFSVVKTNIGCDFELENLNSPMRFL